MTGQSIRTGRTMRTALTIAGSDCSGGAGIQADIKTMTMCGVYAMSAVTALTAQNTTGVFGIMEAAPDFLKQQIDAVASDIPPDAVKIGMVSSAALIHVIADSIERYRWQNVVVDPVMVSTSGARLISEDAVTVLQDRLFPLARLITPNIPETEILTGIAILNEQDMERAAKMISRRYNCAVLCKGGHSINDANDYLADGDTGCWFESLRIDNPNTHGTGCTLSSAIASYMALGYDLQNAVRHAKSYLSGALSAMLDLGKGSGPLMHGYSLRI